MKEQLLSTLGNSRTYTLEVANAMPESSFDFKPAGAGWHFRELLHHIAYGIQWWEQNYIIKTETNWEQPPVKSNKPEVVNFLNSAFSSLENTMGKQKLTDDVIKGFHATLDHITHHRGQAVVYLRCCGITPPEYTY
jgi:uncharacterized damage-inducible protein DinB